MSHCRFLVIVLGTDGIRAPDEWQRINDVLAELERKNQVTTHFGWAPTITKFGELLDRYSPSILHIVGHGADRTLRLVDAQDNPTLLSGKQLAEMLTVRPLRPSLVYLNACQSASLFQDLKSVADSTIGYTGPVEDEYARHIAVHFYRQLALSAQISETDALHTACADCRHTLRSDRSEPQIQTRAGKNPLWTLETTARAPSALAAQICVPLPGLGSHTYRFLTDDDFRVSDDDAAKPLVVGFRPSLAMLRGRQYMPRRNYLDKACKQLDKLLGDRMREDYHELLVFWIAGRSGSGKSVLLLQVMEAMVRRGQRVLWLENGTVGLLPLLAAFHPETGFTGDQIPDLIFIDDMYAPRGQQELDIEAVRRLVASAPQRRWPVVATCGPPEFERQLQRETANDCIQLTSWRLPPVKADEADSLRTWFSDRMRVDVLTDTAFEQSEGLMVSMMFELRHGRLEPFARRFRDRLVASHLDECLRVPLAINRLYVSTPENWLDRNEWERLDELNQDADFSVLESAQGARYLRLTHPHVSDFIYRAVRVPGNARAYANDLIDALRRASESDLFTLRELLRVVAMGHERLDLLDMDYLAEAVGREWQQAAPELLLAEPAVHAEVRVLLAQWSRRQPELRLDERFGASLIGSARDAMRHAGERWPILWIWLQSSYPDDRLLIEDAFQWLAGPESKGSRVWHLIWRRVIACNSLLTDGGKEQSMSLAWGWLQRNPDGHGWGLILETVLNNANLNSEIGAEQLVDLGLTWLEAKLNRTQWYRVWSRLLSDPRLSKEQRIRLLVAGDQQLVRCKCTWSDWTRIWEKLANESELPPEVDRNAVLNRGRRWLAFIEHTNSWSYVWKQLIESPALPADIDRKELLKLGCRLLQDDAERDDWAYVWSQLRSDRDLGDDERRWLLVAGFRWLSGHEGRKDWTFVWEELLDADTLPDAVELSTLFKLGQERLAGQKEANAWTFTWQKLVHAVIESSVPLDIEPLIVLGAEWASKNREHSGFPITAALVVTLSKKPEQYDEIAGCLAKWLSENSAGGATKVVMRRLMRKFGEPELVVTPGIAMLHAHLAKRQRAFERLEELMQDNLTVRGKIVKRVKGGFMVDLEGILVSAFLPGSHVDLRKPRDWSECVGMESEFLISKLDRESLNIVVSRRTLLEGDRAKLAEQLWASLNKGDIVTATVKHIADYGVFVDLGGIDGLLHTADLSWTRVKHPTEIVALEQRLDVKILRFDRHRKKIVVGLKQLAYDPWDHIETEFPLGALVQGTVTRTMAYGAFIRLTEGVEGLVHLSELSWTQRVEHPSELLTVDQQVEVVVISIDREKEKLGLSVKQATQDPWKKAAKKYPPGTVVEGRVKNLKPYGAFVEIESGVVGLLHVNELSWTRKVSHPDELLAMEHIVKCVVLEIDEDRRRLNLSAKQLNDDPWHEAIPSKYRAGMTVHGKVAKTTNFGVFVELEKELVGLLHRSEVSDDPPDTLDDVFSVGQAVDVRILEVDAENRKIRLSLKQVTPSPCATTTAPA